MPPTLSPALGQIIILNGAPRSGKSSIAKVIQETFEGLWMNLGVDAWMQMTPERYQPGIGLRPGGERPDLEPIVAVLYQAMYESIAAHSRLGINVVVDVGHHHRYATPLAILSGCAKRLLGLPVLLVGVHCPVEIIMQRRRSTGWSASLPQSKSIPAPVLRWQQAVHQPGIYDLEINTALFPPQACAEAIQAHLQQGPTPSAIQQLASLPVGSQ